MPSKTKQPGRRYPLFPPLTTSSSSGQGRRSCQSLVCSGKRIGAIVYDDDRGKEDDDDLMTTSYGLVIDDSSSADGTTTTTTTIPLVRGSPSNHHQQRRSAADTATTSSSSQSSASSSTAIALSRYDASLVAIGNDDGSVQVYSVDADGNNCDMWIDGYPTASRYSRRQSEAAIAALEFVPAPSPRSNNNATTTTRDSGFITSLVLLTRNGNLIAMDVFADQEAAADTAASSRGSLSSNETTRLLSSSLLFDDHREQQHQRGSFRVQASIKLADVVFVGSSEQPTGALLVLSEVMDRPLVLIGMSGGTLLVMCRKADDDEDHGDGDGDCGYTWDCVKKLSLPSAVLSLALSTHGSNCLSKFSMLAAGLEDGEVALLDATDCKLVRKDDDQKLYPPYSPFHFLRANHDDGVPVSQLSFFWSVSGDKGCHQLHLAIISGSLLRIANMSTFEVFFVYHSDSRIRDITFFPDGPEKILVAREDGVSECVTWSTWRFLFGESSFQKLHSNFQPKMRSATEGTSRASVVSNQSQFANLFDNHSVRSLHFSGDSNTFAVACGREVVLCDSSGWLPDHDKTVRTPVERLRLDDHSLSVDQVILSHDASLLAIVTTTAINGRSRFHVRLFNCSESSEGLVEWNVRDSVTFATAPFISFSPLNRRLLVTESHKLSVYDLDSTCTLEASFAEISPSVKDSSSFVSSLFLPDGNTIAVLCSSGVIFYNAEEFFKETQLEIPRDHKTTSMSFKANSRTVAVATENGYIHVANKNSSHGWDVRKTVKTDGAALVVLFSPDISSSFLAVIDGNGRTCSIYGTDSFQVIQEISCSQRDCHFTSLAFDPSGTILAIGGESRLLGSEQSGTVLVLRVGELLRLEWFFPGNHFADPALLCSKLSSLTAVERAQILFHRTDDGEQTGSHGHFPLERRISSAVDIARKENSKAALGSSIICAKSPFDSLIACLKHILIAFPQAVFVGSPGFGNLFNVILERDNPRLLRLLFYVSLGPCSAFPYLVFNEEMRSGTVTKALIDSCEAFPKVVYDVVSSMVLWPMAHFSTEVEDWRVPKDEPVFIVGNTHTLDQISDNDWTKMKGGITARPMILPVPDISTLAFLGALTTDCDANIFAVNELGITLEKLWEEEIKWVFILDFILQLIFIGCWAKFVTMTNMSGSEGTFGGQNLDRTSMVLMLVIFVMDLLLIYKGIRQIESVSEWYKPDHILKFAEKTQKTVQHALRQVWLNPLSAFGHSIAWMMGERVEDWWMYCDFMTHWMVIATLLQSIWRTEVTVAFAVVTTFSILLKLLGYLRGFENCGWLLSVLHQNIVDSKGFLVVIFTILVGFSVMFRILLGPYDYHDYGKLSASFTSMFEMGILGFVDRNQFQQMQSPVLTLILLVLLILVVYIVALNGYIALLGGSYARVAQNEVANKRYQKATLIVGYLKLINQKHRERLMEERRYLFALVPIIDDHHDGGNKSKDSSQQSIS